MESNAPDINQRFAEGGFPFESSYDQLRIMGVPTNIIAGTESYTRVHQEQVAVEQTPVESPQNVLMSRLVEY